VVVEQNPKQAKNGTFPNNMHANILNVIMNLSICEKNKRFCEKYLIFAFCSCILTIEKKRKNKKQKRNYLS